MNLLQKIFDLRSSADPEGSIERISQGVSIRGYNMWLLFCSAALASIGLDTNSTAVIIGAMLISPLMSPILGIGLSLGIHDNQLLLRSLKNLSIAVVLSLIASSLYFSISPFANPTAELQVRTYPTLLDVMVALFGGLAGIISSSRSGPSIALPGVAIATALMPPLCTAGYGLATGQWNYFAGAFYLFFINAVFISMATYLIVKYLRFPEKVYRTRRQQRLSNLLFGVLLLLATLPSAYFLFTVYKREMERKQINSIVVSNIKKQGNEILKMDLEKTDTATLIKVYHSGRPISDSVRALIAQELAAQGLKGHRLLAQRVNMTKEEVNEVSTGIIRNMFQQFELEHQRESASDSPDSLYARPLGAELKLAFPFLDTVYNGAAHLPDSAGAQRVLPMVFYRSGQRVSAAQEERLYRYLLARFAADTVVLIRR
jgi:uncharacterized hydrophobic protein (TIGR00271 family)